MTRRAALACAVIALAGCTTSPLPSATPAATTSPSASTVPASAAPASIATPGPASPATTAHPQPTEGGTGVGELVIPLDLAPAFPTPLLLSGRGEHPAIGSWGCPTVYYEPDDDPFGRLSSVALPDCLTADFPLVRQVTIAPGADITINAPAEWALGAQLLREGGVDALWTVSAAKVARVASGTRIRSADREAWLELMSGTGFGLTEVASTGLHEPGDYLLSVEAQVGQRDRTWRIGGLRYIWWLRVE